MIGNFSARDSLLVGFSIEVDVVNASDRFNFFSSARREMKMANFSYCVLAIFL